uniref:Chromo domain-containing protein n=1 Tax=Chenopodium quinoa TaxID=63459 RepID=A0A803MB64_CHEQI
MEAQLKTLEQRLEDQNSKIEQKFEEMLKLMQVLQAKKVSNPSSSEPSSPTLSNGSLNRSNPTRTLGMNPKLEFPKFNGLNPRIWVKKCYKYFTLCKIADDQKVDLASLNMIDKAENWVMNYLSIRRSVVVDWNDFVVDLYARFQDDSALDVVEQFNRLQQSGSIEDYIDEFEKPAVKPFVKAFKPLTIAQAVEYARLQEQSLSCTSFVSHKHNKPFGYFQKTQASNTSPLTTTATNTLPPLLPTPKSKPTLPALTQTPHNTKNYRYIPADVRKEKIAKGLCYYCDQPYSREHQCQFKKPQLFTVEIPGCQEFDDEMEELEMVDKPVSEPRISTNALAGNHSFQTMRVLGRLYGKDLHIEIDYGSTHNFVDVNVAQKLGSTLDKIPLQTISVADGNNIPCQLGCKGFAWEMQGHTFDTDSLLIPLGSCDMVTEAIRSVMQLEHDNLDVLSCSEFLSLEKQYGVVFEEPTALPPEKGSEVLLMAISVVDSTLGALIASSYQLDDNYLAIIQQLKNHIAVHDFKWENNLLKRKGKIVVGPDTQLRNKILSWHHDSPESGHGGRELTLKRLTPYEVVYNQPPPLHLPYLAREVKNDEVDRSLQRRERMISELRHSVDSDDIKPAAILDRKMVKFQNKAQVQYLVHWEGFPSYEATWELAENLEQSVSSTNGASMKHLGSLLHSLVVACNLMATTWLWASIIGAKQRRRQPAPQPGCGGFLRATTYLWQLVSVAFESPI